ncbi:MAG: hypothetical protein GY845_17045 [Planctomycetes bacterium]|nr:hypothetical protein [Planctomycetota bacterium]
MNSPNDLTDFCGFKENDVDNDLILVINRNNKALTLLNERKTHVDEEVKTITFESSDASDEEPGNKIEAYELKNLQRLDFAFLDSVIRVDLPPFNTKEKLLKWIDNPNNNLPPDQMLQALGSAFSDDNYFIINTKAMDLLGLLAKVPRPAAITLIDKFLKVFFKNEKINPTSKEEIIVALDKVNITIKPDDDIPIENLQVAYYLLKTIKKKNHRSKLFTALLNSLLFRKL